MTEPPNTAEARVTALAEAAGLAIPPDYLAGVAVNLDRLLIQARLLSAIVLPVEAEPAPVFRP